MRTIFLTSIVFSLFSHSMVSMCKFKSVQDTIFIKKECSVKNLMIKTERRERNRKFIFWKLPHKKITIVDKVINTDGKVIFKKSTILVCSADACGDTKFRRIKIIKNEIWIFQYNRNPDNAVIKHYDFCGKYLNKTDWNEKSFDEY